MCEFVSFFLFFTYNYIPYDLGGRGVCRMAKLEKLGAQLGAIRIQNAKYLLTPPPERAIILVPLAQ
jgi:hypothetical protein